MNYQQMLKTHLNVLSPWSLAFHRSSLHDTFQDKIQFPRSRSHWFSHQKTSSVSKCLIKRSLNVVYAVSFLFIPLFDCHSAIMQHFLTMHFGNYFAVNAAVRQLRIQFCGIWKRIFWQLCWTLRAVAFSQVPRKPWRREENLWHLISLFILLNGKHKTINLQQGWRE